uniref:receptor protein-tyrosine kinase n=1 Tax=Poecilia mexicana TaxID=48701 RepID=A0A3B3XQ77_9TELE
MSAKEPWSISFKCAIENREIFEIIGVSCFISPVAVCSGTQNGMSTTGDPENHYKLMKERYTGCNIVMGNLEIILMQHTRDFSFLQSIKEVTGHVVFAMNEFSRLPLDNLRVIRGNNLYEDRYALAVMLNYQKDGQHGLQELGLTNLTEILEGGVQIFDNKYLSYAPQVNWLDIVKDASLPLSPYANSNFNANSHFIDFCVPHCTLTSLEGQQTSFSVSVTKTVCAPQCNSRCFGRNPSDCCHVECAGGCNGPLDTDCFACKNFNNSGSCVLQCPQTLIYNKQSFKMERNPNAKYQYGSICVAQCPPNFVVDGSSCVRNCPADKMEVDKNGAKRCEPCRGLCPKGNHFISSNIGMLLLITRNICYTKLRFNAHGAVILFAYYLNIQSWPKSLSNLSVFSNLQTIQGRKLYSGYSFLVMNIPSLTSLGLRSLQKLNDGGVYITKNKNLCYYNTVNWMRIISSPQKQQNSRVIKENRKAEQCDADGHVCDPLCADGCWGAGPDQCVSCNKYSRGGTCVSDCMFLTGTRREFATKSGECLPCHPECKVQEGMKTCTGPGADQCVACSSLQDGPHCVSSCPDGVMGGEGVIFKYASKQGRCETCHMNCTQG